jgi:hypothetical protein
MSVTDHPAFAAMKEKEELQLMREAAKEGLDNEMLVFSETVHEYFRINAELLLSKHKDYGPTNISNAPGGAINGLRVRMHDKLARINHLTDSGKPPENESLRDSFIDLANYAIIGLLVLDKKWPKK